jgi:hypothetical protein
VGHKRKVAEPTSWPIPAAEAVPLHLNKAVKLEVDLESAPALDASSRPDIDLASIEVEDDDGFLSRVLC